MSRLVDSAGDFLPDEKMIEEICGDDVPLFYGVPMTSFCNAHHDKIINATEKR
jgi:hypothetical protein